jgi:integrase/recombinase XerD
LGLKRQAKILSKGQSDAVLAFLTSTRYPERNRAIFLLSVRAGLRAKEIASLTWPMVTDAEGNIGDAIRLVDEASKGSSGRVIPLNKELKAALAQIQKSQVGGRSSPFVVTTERAKQTSAAAIVNLFAAWYRALGFNGCSSHSGRRGFITNAARKISTVGGSLRDVQLLAGHSSLSTTQRYIEANSDAQRRIVDLV